MNDDNDPPMLAFCCEDSLAMKKLAEAVRCLTKRLDLDGDDARLLRTILFGLERLPFTTPDMGVLLILKAENGPNSDWVELRLAADELSLGRGVWTQGDAHSETIFEVTEFFRDDNPYQTLEFAQEFEDCAEEPERVIQIEETTLAPFDGWDLVLPDRDGWHECDFELW
jgi:hypothetical protein